MVKTSLQTSSSISSIALQNDGKIVAAGITSNSYPSTNFALARYNTDGSLDNTFGTAGKVITDVYSFGDGDDGIYSIKIQSNGKLVVGGFAGSRCALVRYIVDGSLDNNFGVGGIVIADSIPFIVDMAIQVDGEILVTGTPNTVLNLLTRFNYDGVKDTSFGDSGSVITDVNPGDGYAQCLEIQPDGKIVLGGSVKVTTTPVEGLLIRFNSDININENIKRNNLLSIYPNPIKNNLIIAPQAIISGKIKIELFDVLGNLVLSENRILGNEPLTLNIASVRNGSYVFHITFEDGSTDVFKVVVNC